MTMAAATATPRPSVMPTYRKYERQDTLKVNDATGDRQTTGDADPPTNAAEALNTQQIFDRAQVAWLMHQAMRWGHDLGWEEGHEAGYAAGYQACADEVDQAARLAVHDFNHRDVADGLARKWLREQYDATLRTPRPGDFPGRDTKQAGLRVAA